MSKDFEKKLIDIITKFGEEETDVLLFCGPIEKPYDGQAINCFDNQKYTKALLFLTTFGGSAHAAYRIARRLQKCYKSTSIFINTCCKSAGTLLALGANEIIMSDLAEIGPLDVQLLKADELGERSSGLTITQALSSLQNEAFSMFEEYFLDLRFKSQLQITTKTAAEIAANLTVGLFKPIYNQIDPLRIGEIDRAVRISKEYGIRIKNENVKPDVLDKLIGGYPDHNFAIDRTEAKDLFFEVRKPSDLEKELANHLEVIVEDALVKNKTLVHNITADIKEKDEEGSKTDDQACEGDIKKGDRDQEIEKSANVSDRQDAEKGDNADKQDEDSIGENAQKIVSVPTAISKGAKATT